MSDNTWFIDEVEVETFPEHPNEGKVWVHAVMGFDIKLDESGWTVQGEVPEFARAAIEESLEEGV